MNAGGDLTEIDRKRLASILGLLGSDAAGERENAARLAEQFRREQNVTWAELLARPSPEPIFTQPPPPSFAYPGCSQSEVFAEHVQRFQGRLTYKALDGSEIFYFASFWMFVFLIAQVFGSGFSIAGIMAMITISVVALATWLWSCKRSLT